MSQESVHMLYSNEIEGCVQENVADLRGFCDNVAHPGFGGGTIEKRRHKAE